MVDTITFLKGNKSGLPTSGAAPGAIYCCLDTGGIYIANEMGVPILIANINTDTHYTTQLFVTDKNGTANATTTNGNTYLRLFDNSTARQSIKIIGDGATTVTSDANGVITISSTDTQSAGTITGVSANGTSIATSGVANIPAASTSKYGVTKLSNSTNSTSTSLAATASAVKTVYDLANSKAPAYRYEIEDLIAGESELETGKLYFVYE